MQYFNLIPFSTTLFWFSVLLLIVWAVDFLQGDSAVQLPADSRRERTKFILADILIFAGINSLLLYVLHPLSNPLLISLVAAGLLVTYFMTSGMRKRLSPYQPWILLIHVVLGISFYLLFGMLLMSRLIVTYNLNMTNQFDILYFVYGQDREVVYVLLLIMTALYFVIGKLLMRPLYNWYAENYYQASRMNIKLVGGEFLNGVYILRDTDRGFLSASDSLNPGPDARLYRISREKIEYMERAGSVS
ncbi:hypothetical protein C173_20231 [Paenibacillus sp. FSL R7-277]|uniref:hypothetical protein n=1 Tax=Paenibacillus sp. FSL R7-277 TaxID=1227352 RepID=UPI0003E2BCC8|nr:hypothetical protein [Paenibacillus sp. FSL R7-277]ETT65392.1 hypothetical protein C173_20231 [Paenibacillus sp. FSL R7-277]